MDADAQRTAQTATEGILAAWGEHAITPDEARVPNELEAVAWRLGLQQMALTVNRSMLRLLDLPAVLALRVPGLTAPRYVALIAMDSSRLASNYLDAPQILSIGDSHECEERRRRITVLVARRHGVAVTVGVGVSVGAGLHDAGYGASNSGTAARSAQSTLNSVSHSTQSTMS